LANTRSQPVLQKPVLQEAEQRIGLIGPVVVVLALLSGLASFLIIGGITPILPTRSVVIALFLSNAVFILILLLIVVFETRNVLRAKRAGQAGSRLHATTVGSFSLVAAVPAILVAIVASITLDRALQPWFFGPIRSVVESSSSFARAFVDLQCVSLQRDAVSIASDIDRFVAIKVRSGSQQSLFDEDRSYFVQFILSRVVAQQFGYAAIVKADGSNIQGILNNGFETPPAPTAQELEFASSEKPACPNMDASTSSISSLRSIRKLSNLPDAYLLATRAVDPLTNEFFKNSSAAIAEYQRLEQVREIRQIDFMAMYGLIALILLLVATWLGLNFANRLVTPIRRLIHATDEVASGNYYAQVPIRKSDGDLAHLGRTFNKMTSELRGQHNKLTTATQVIDKRRRFTEAVLSGVPAGVIGLDELGRITVTNPVANRLLSMSANAAMGQKLVELLPSIKTLVDDAINGRQKLGQGQINVLHDANEQTLNVRVTSEQAAGKARGFVVTLDDISDLVQAQRTSAWADVARRIAHEIKNPLTPIQLSAERLKRKYGKVIVEDKHIFDQCTDTIVRQVEDIKRMVDEFSSFARMPKPQLGDENLVECVRQVLFLSRIGYPDVTFEDDLPDDALTVKFDRRLISQALTNILKNATEGITELPDIMRGSGVVRLKLERTSDSMVVFDIADNGKGFPVENRRRLLEPYMTTREGGTGLGLPIVAKIFEEHGGGIDLGDGLANTKGGFGARVRLWFPFIQTDIPQLERDKDHEL
jgi:two-component system, NtrC family, nitrogen regulation sensor histidine kinase NtrY